MRRSQGEHPDDRIIQKVVLGFLFRSLTFLVMKSFIQTFRRIIYNRQLRSRQFSFFGENIFFVWL